VRVGPQNSQRYGTDSSRLRQPVDGSTDTERDAGTGRQQQQRNGKPQRRVTFSVSSFSYQAVMIVVITFHLSRRRHKMYIGHTCLSVCVSMARRIPTLLHGPGCNSWNGRGCPLVVHYWVDLQLVHGFRWRDNIVCATAK